MEQRGYHGVGEEEGDGRRSKREEAEEGGDYYPIR